MIDYKADPKFWQRFLKCNGFYNGDIEGAFGPKSMQAGHEFEQASINLANQLGGFYGRSESNIQTFLAAAQRKARQLMKTVQALASPWGCAKGMRANRRSVRKDRAELNSFYTKI
jgi:hypothetical protein